MRLWIRLAIVAALLAGIGMALVHLRTEVMGAGNRFHQLYAHKRRLEKQCWRLHLAIARLKSPDRLRAYAGDLEEDEPELLRPPPQLDSGPPETVAERRSPP